MSKNTANGGIIIIEDNDTMRLGMVESLRREGYDIKAFDNPQDGLAHFRKYPAPLIVSDLRMEPFDGISLLKKVKEIQPATELILVSAFGTVETAVEAMHLGATDFLTKPFSPDELRIRVNKVMENIRRQKDYEVLRERHQLLQSELFEEIIGASESIQELYRLVQKIAVEDSTVLIQGESGTGKELIARAIHRSSPRSELPFVGVNCGALNDNLLESELFGHEKGAFTGAHKRKLGRFELAHRGTIFLDEIGDISPTMQIKLLRVLQEREFERVGGEETIAVDVRIICATHQDLKGAVNEGRFREDLYYRLSVIPLRVPPLRERREDIPALVRHFLQLRGTAGREKSISNQGMDLLRQYSWPGNVRELENLIERLRVISPENEIPTDLIAAQLGNNAVAGAGRYQNLPLDDALFAFEKSLIEHAMKEADGVKNRAAKLLGIKTSSLYYKLEKFGLLE